MDSFASAAGRRFILDILTICDRYERRIAFAAETSGQFTPCDWYAVTRQHVEAMARDGLIVATEAEPVWKSLLYVITPRGRAALREP